MKTFIDLKKKIVSKLTNCKQKIEEIERLLKEIEKTLDLNFNIDLKETKEKIDRTIDDIEREKLKIVFLGAFSDGKSTILSALLNRTDIKIAPEPTTDKIKPYEYKDFFVVDTPGLFSEKKEHDELTKKYISEADIIIFVTDALNPLKESQHDTIKWILKDLNKLNQTIFVINKLDTTGIDLENTEEFKIMCEIKKQSVKETLDNILGESCNSYIIVCLSADPDKKGISYWLANKEQYDRLSNIKELEEILDKIVKTDKCNLIFEKVKSVLKDIVIKNKKDLERVLEIMQESLNVFKQRYEKLGREVDNINKEISKSVKNLKKKIMDYRNDLINKIHSCIDGKCLKRLKDNEFGKDGYIIQQKIELIFQEELEHIRKYTQSSFEIIKEIEMSYERLEENIIDFMKKGIGFARNISKAFGSVSTKKILEVISKGIENLKIPIKIDFSKISKITKFLQGISVIIVILDSLISIVDQVTFESNQKKLIESIDNIFKELLNNINEDNIKETYFPNVVELEKKITELKAEMEKREEILNKTIEIKNLLASCEDI